MLNKSLFSIDCLCLAPLYPCALVQCNRPNKMVNTGWYKAKVLHCKYPQSQYISDLTAHR